MKQNQERNQIFIFAHSQRNDFVYRVGSAISERFSRISSIFYIFDLIFNFFLTYSIHYMFPLLVQEARRPRMTVFRGRLASFFF